MREEDLDRAERRAVQRNDQRVREQAQQGSTFKAFADADTSVPGRFESISAAHVIGSTEIPKSPAASTPFQRDPVPDEPPLAAYENPALENPTGVPSVPPSVATGGGAEGA